MVILLEPRSDALGGMMKRATSLICLLVFLLGRILDLLESMLILLASEERSSPNIHGQIHSFFCIDMIDEL
jgi:hypothetical protein